MVHRDLTSLSETELLELFLETNYRLQELVQQPRTIYLHDPDFAHAEAELSAIYNELNKRGNASATI